MPLLHQCEEQAYLNRFYFDVAQFIDQQAIVGGKGFDNFGFCVVCYGLVKLFHELGESDKSSFIPPLNGMDQKSGCQAGFTSSGRAYPYHISIVLHVVKGVI